jgi:hypothetical protein
MRRCWDRSGREEKMMERRGGGGEDANREEEPAMQISNTHNQTGFSFLWLYKKRQNAHPLSSTLNLTKPSVFMAAEIR